MEKKHILCYASDGKDYDRLEMSAWSARKFLGDDVQIVVLTSHYFYPAIHGVKLITPIDYLREVGIFPYGWNRPKYYSALHRLIIPLIKEFENVDRVVYLDNDTLIFSEEAKDILFNSELPDYEVIGVPDVARLRSRTKNLINNEVNEYSKSKLREMWERTNKYNTPYINAGAIIFNLKRIRENGIDWYKERLKMFWDHELSGKFHYIDQDFINVMLEVSPSIDDRINVIAQRDRKDAILRHYVGDWKRYQSPDAIKLGYFKNAAASNVFIRDETSISGKSQLILYISHKINDETLWRYRKLRDDVKPLGIDVVWCFNNKNDIIKIPNDVSVEMASDDAILSSDKFLFKAHNKPLTWSVPAYFLMKIFEKYSEYEYIWIVEYDVCYSGNWKNFFERMNKLPHDFICEKLTSRYSSSRWCWWPSSCMYGVHWKNMYKSLNCISRVSRKLYESLLKFYNGYRAKIGLFFENLWPSVATMEGSCFDIYTTECVPTFSYGSDCVKNMDKAFPEKLYHAVKDNIKWKDKMP